MKPPLDGGTVVVTGASSGIGTELARQLADRAKCLVLVARRVARLDALADELRKGRPQLRVEVMPCDLSDLEVTAAFVDELQERVGVVDVLINNAGLGDLGLFERSEWDKIERMIQVNVVALTFLTRRLVGPMVKQGRGGILNISSGFGVTWMPGVASYAGTKHYVTAFTEALRLELKGTGVVVTQICPGPVATEFEEVAGNPTGQDPPAIVLLTAEECARASLRAFDRNRAMSVPGILIALITYLGAYSPRWILRLMYGWMGGWLRKRADAEAS